MRNGSSPRLDLAKRGQRAAGFLLRCCDGVRNVCGSAHHPQSQGPVERPHREYNKLAELYRNERKDD